MTKHPNSHLVTVYRRETFINEAQKKTALDFVSQSRKGIGSYWEKSTSRTVATGLNFTEQKLLLPAVVDCEDTDRNFRQKVTEYYMAFSTNVPYDKGVTLEIGLEQSNDEPLSKDNLPLDVHQYLTYRHIIGHPLVAMSKAEAQENMLKEFYIFDPQQAEKENLILADDKDKALELYLKLKTESAEKPEKVDMLLTLLGHDPREFKGANALKLKLETVKKHAESDADKFVKRLQDRFFEELYVIQTLVNTGVFQRIGDRLIDKDSGETIGHNTSETVAWLKDKANSQKVALLKSRMQEAISKPLPAKSKLTK